MGYQGAEREKAEDAALLMGYQHSLQGAVLSLNGLENGMVQAQVEVTLKQDGNAPFYYDLYASLSDESGATLAEHTTNLKGVLPGEETTLTFQLGSLSVEQVLGPIDLVLSSPKQLPGQHILLSTSTPWTIEGAPTRLQWDVTCDAAGALLSLGETLIQEGTDCTCICDVDGQIRDCAGAPCF